MRRKGALQGPGRAGFLGQEPSLPWGVSHKSSPFRAGARQAEAAARGWGRRGCVQDEAFPWKP